MESKLNVEIGAELGKLNSDFAKAVNVVTAGSQQMGNAVSKTEKQFQILNNTKFTFGANYLSVSQKLANEAGKAGAILGGSTVKGANQAAFALNNLGRVAQDAPFGFIGIQNNLNPLLESFQLLKAQTGSASLAFKALGASLIGPAGLGIALSVVSAAVLFYQQYQQRANKTTNEAKKAADEYVNSLGQVEQARLKGAQNAASELTTLKLLYQQTQNVNLSQKQRLDAVNQLQEKYPDYFKNIKDETFLSGGAAAAYDRLTTSVLATARARAAGDLITKNSSRLLENEQKIIDLGIKSAKNRELIQKSVTGARGASGELGEAKATMQLTEALKEQSVIDKLINNLVTDSVILRDKNLQLEKSVNIEIGNGAILTGTVGKEIENNVKKTEKLKKVTQEWLDLMFAKQRDKTVAGLSTETFLPKGDLQSDITKKVQAANLAQLKKGQEEYLRSLEKFSNAANSVIQNGLVNGLGGIGEAIGSALASGENVLAAFGNSILSTIGDILVQFGKLTIAAGVAALALKSALKLGNPIAAIAAGVALVAIGSLVKGGSIASGNNGEESQGSRPRKIPGFANGVKDFQGGIALVGERGPEIVTLPTGSSVIPNHNIATMGGGGSEIVLQASIGMRLDDLFVRLEEVGKRRRRLGIA